MRWKKPITVLLIIIGICLVTYFNRDQTPQYYKELHSIAASALEDRGYKYEDMFDANKHTGTILNHGGPEIDLILSGDECTILKVTDDGAPVDPDIVGELIWRVTYRTTRDSILGPVRIYIDYETREVLYFGGRC